MLRQKRKGIFSVDICYIIGAGDNDDTVLQPQKKDLVIAADAGFAYLEKISVKADLVVGDFDSLKKIPVHPNVIMSPAEKDETDMILAVQEGLKRGYRTFVVFGCTGGRFDHTFSAVQTLAGLTENGASGYMLGGGMVITAVKNGMLKLDGNKQGIISVFSNAGASRGVDLTGLKYKLENATVTSHTPIGVSNEFAGRESAVSVKEGTLIVMWYQSSKEALRDIVEGATLNLSGFHEASNKKGAY